jgi:hypothetical protein
MRIENFVSIQLLSICAVILRVQCCYGNCVTQCQRNIRLLTCMVVIVVLLTAALPACHDDGQKVGATDEKR